MTIRAWVDYLEESFLFHECYRFDSSLRKQHSFSRKYYGVDCGMRNAVSFRFSNDAGLLLEQVVWLELIRRRYTVYWLKGKGECDFLISERGEITGAIQVSLELMNENREREISGIIEAMRVCNCKNGLILTLRQFDKIDSGDYVIEVMPVWHWVLSYAKFPFTPLHYPS